VFWSLPMMLIILWSQSIASGSLGFIQMWNVGWYLQKWVATLSNICPRSLVASISGLTFLVELQGPYLKGFHYFVHISVVTYPASWFWIISVAYPDVRISCLWIAGTFTMTCVVRNLTHAQQADR
jgi:hypothetical protein